MTEQSTGLSWVFVVLGLLLVGVAVTVFLVRRDRERAWVPATADVVEYGLRRTGHGRRHQYVVMRRVDSRGRVHHCESRISPVSFREPPFPIDVLVDPHDAARFTPAARGPWMLLIGVFALVGLGFAAFGVLFLALGI